MLLSNGYTTEISGKESLLIGTKLYNLMQTKNQYFILGLFACFIISGIQAQPVFGVKAGLNIANVRLSGPLIQNPSSLVTFRVGGMVDIPMGEAFSIQPGLFINSKGFEYSDNIEVVSYNPIYFDIPILLLGKFDAGGVRAFAGLGPYVGFGFAGKAKLQSGGFSQNFNIQFGNTYLSDFKSVDFGLQFSGGVEFEGGIVLGISYDFGLVNVIPVDNSAGQNGATAQHRVLLFSVGYFF